MHDERNIQEISNENRKTIKYGIETSNRPSFLSAYLPNENKLATSSYDFKIKKTGIAISMFVGYAKLTSKMQGFYKTSDLINFCEKIKKFEMFILFIYLFIYLFIHSFIHFYQKYKQNILLGIYLYLTISLYIETFIIIIKNYIIEKLLLSITFDDISRKISHQISQFVLVYCEYET